MKKELFIIYANLPAKDIPQGIYKLLKINWKEKDPRVQSAIDEVWKYDHQHFRDILTAIIGGKKYSKIPELKSFERHIEQGTFPESKPTFWEPVLDSLFCFLNDKKKGPERLRACFVCSNFFYAHHKKKEVCSENCEKIRSRKWHRQYMSERRNKEGSKFNPIYVK